MKRAKMTLLSEMDAIMKVLDLMKMNEAEMVKDEGGGGCQDLRLRCLR